MGTESDRNTLSTRDLKFFENFWNDAIWRTAIPSQSHEAIAVFEDAQVREFRQILRKPTTRCCKLEGMYGALIRKGQAC